MQKTKERQKTIDFYPLKEQIYIKGIRPGKCLRIAEKTLIPSEISESEVAFDTNSYKISVKVDAIYGIIKLISDSYFIIVDSSTKVATIMGHTIHQALSFKFIPVKKMINSNKEKLGQDNIKSRNDQKFIDMFLNILNSQSFYYSDTYNLTNTLQTLVDLGFEKLYGKQSFWVNHCYLKNFIASDCNYLDYVSPFVFGFIDQKKIYIKKTNQDLWMTIISRKDVARLGARFFSRGADASGNISNFVETETILDFTEKERNMDSGLNFDKVISFVQIRGSIPFIWNQMPSLKFVPRVKISENQSKNRKAYRAHFNTLLKKHGKIQIVNLIRKTGDQGKLGTYYQETHQNLAQEDKNYSESVSLTWFDFLDECKGMKLENLQKLLNQIKTNINNFKWFECNYRVTELDNGEFDYGFKVVRYQKGVIRTNCMDNLDRTNVVQSVFSRYFVKTQLEQKSIIPQSRTIFHPFPPLIERGFRFMWTDNADQLSIIYSGTPALKTDFTRTGKRSYAGVVKDTVTSTKRYFINQILDYENQNAFDFFMTKISVKNYQFYETGKGELKRCFLYEERAYDDTYPFHL